MYNVLIADDEPLLLRNIKSCIEKANSHFRVCWQAMNGEDALALAQQEHPDVIVTDIRMPVMDGLALAGELRQRGLEMPVVVLSGYHEFEYARQALGLGVVEYLLKPISQPELSALLTKLETRLEKEAAGRRYRLLFAAVVGGEENALRQTDESCFREYRWFRTSLICFGSYCEFDSFATPEPREYWGDTPPEQLLGSLVKTQSFWILPSSRRNINVLVFADKTDETVDDPVEERFFSRCGSLPQQPTVVVGQPSAQIGELPYHCQCNEIDLKKYLLFGRPSLIGRTQHGPDESNAGAFLNHADAGQLRGMIESGQAEQLKQRVCEILKTCEALPITQTELARLLKQIAGLFQPCCPLMPQGYWVEVEMEIDELIGNTDGYYALADGMRNILEILFYGMRQNSLKPGTQQEIAQRLEKYLRSRFNGPVSLQAAADEMGLVLPYLSSVFKKYKGVSPMKFILRLRVEKAKELLRDRPDLNVREIAQNIGYDDPYFMSRVFKNATGKSPTEYRCATGCAPQERKMS